MRFKKVIKKFARSKIIGYKLSSVAELEEFYRYLQREKILRKASKNIWDTADKPAPAFTSTLTYTKPPVHDKTFTYTVGNDGIGGDAGEYSMRCRGGGGGPANMPDMDSFFNLKPVPGRNFLLGEFPVTQRQWVEVMGDNPSYFRARLDQPVESISYSERVEHAENMKVLTSKFNYLK